MSKIDSDDDYGIAIRQLLDGSDLQIDLTAKKTEMLRKVQRKCPTRRSKRQYMRNKRGESDLVADQPPNYMPWQ